ncbi:hypothetical protein AVEN_193789-1 [Araneus ventricosus]|uniref:Uncharacterized protein n=1 Tax=Araneus ventricosus TaxID=182803 RepID=A0A4Y2DMV9_ARAVE|nr:hypothetical protein AVEN_193789-1 [Araneus ventricosus]
MENKLCDLESLPDLFSDIGNEIYFVHSTSSENSDDGFIQSLRRITEVYGNVMNEASDRKWCIMFNAGGTNIHDEERSGRLSVVTNSNQGLRKKLNRMDVLLFMD